MYASEAAFALRDLRKLDELLSRFAGLAPSERKHSVQAHEARLQARLAEARGERDAVEPRYKRAAALFREVGMPFWLGVTLLEHGEWLAGDGRSAQAEPLLEAREIFERLRARPWLERLSRVSGAAAGAVAWPAAERGPRPRSRRSRSHAPATSARESARPGRSGVRETVPRDAWLPHCVALPAVATLCVPRTGRGDR